MAVEAFGLESNKGKAFFGGGRFPLPIEIRAVNFGARVLPGVVWSQSGGDTRQKSLRIGDVEGSSKPRDKEEVSRATQISREGCPPTEIVGSCRGYILTGIPEKKTL